MRRSSSAANSIGISPAFVAICVLLMMMMITTTVQAQYPSPDGNSSNSDFKVGYYKRRCPAAERLVRSVVRLAVLQNPGIGAGLIRMHFHDCFVRGCDGSVLIDSTPVNTAEKDSLANFPSLRGFEVIDQAKSLLESYCPTTVSCADILAFAARDSSYFTGGLDYAVPSGRRDGTVSNVTEVLRNLPAPFFGIQQLISSFARKNMSVEELVILSGAHTIGRSHCSSFSSRLYSFNATFPQDPSMDPHFASMLKTKCPNNISASFDPVVPQDRVTPDIYDNKYYKNAQKNQVLFTSDQVLQDSAATTDLVEEYAKNGKDWKMDFTKAMVHLGTIEVLTGEEGQIRLNCRVVNP